MLIDFSLLSPILIRDLKQPREPQRKYKFTLLIRDYSNLLKELNW